MQQPRFAAMQLLNDPSGLADKVIVEDVESMRSISEITFAKSFFTNFVFFLFTLSFRFLRFSGGALSDSARE